MRYPADPAALRIGSPEWRRFMVQEVGLPEAWLNFAASGANLPFELADRQGRFDDMMQMLGRRRGQGRGREAEPDARLPDQSHAHDQGLVRPVGHRAAQAVCREVWSYCQCDRVI